MKEGFWGNYQTGQFFAIDEHERWIRRAGNAERLGVPAALIAQFGSYPGRDTLFPLLWQHAPVMRWRGHGASVSFEFYAEDWAMPLELMKKWGTLYAGAYLLFHMVNFRGMEIRDTLWKDFQWHTRLKKN